MIMVIVLKYNMMYYYVQKWHTINMLIGANERICLKLVTRINFFLVTCLVTISTTVQIGYQNINLTEVVWNPATGRSVR